MAFDKSKYDTNYNQEHVIRKVIGFNENNPEDQKILAHLNRQPNYSKYIKNLILEDIKKDPN